jgi:hypothetical protein
MIKYSRLFIIVFISFIAFGANAQSTASSATTGSPYSRYGLGDINPLLLPQNTAMGGISAAINRISGYNNINPENPASYGYINFTTIDAGIFGNFTSVVQQPAGQSGNISANNSAFRLSHVAFAIPVTKLSALSFGLLPYSEMGYNYKTSRTGYGTGAFADTNTVNYVYNGSGGLSKAYLGYGIGITKNLLVGANLSYIFGNLQQFSSMEIPTLYGFLNSRSETDNHVGGFNYDIGAQYILDFGTSKLKHLTLAYSSSIKSLISSNTDYVVSHYTITSGEENPATDSLVNQKGVSTKIQLPWIHHFGISYQYDGKFLVGADYSIANWSSLSIAGVNQTLQNSKTLNLGGQITPDINALNNYFARADYRFGFMTEETFLNINNNSIKKYAFTFGLGLPLPPNLNSFYKINFSTEFGQEGTLQNSLVREKFINFRLSFTVNDKWFQRYKFE